jgi:anthranilate phosphoribosyltransferase
MNLNTYLDNLLSDEVSNELKSVLLTELKPELISSENLSFFRSYILEKAIKINLQGLDTIDICGTGGDGKDTINISTAAAFLIAACGYKVTKHGNFGFSSKCGSSDILNSLGLKLPQTPSDVIKNVEKFNLSFIHAPFFHPGLKALGPIRKAIKIKTIFNLLGPLCNPAQPSASFLGVADYSTYRLYQSVLSNESNSYLIGYDQNGYDECSLTARFFINNNQINDYFNPDKFIKYTIAENDLIANGSLEERTKVFLKVISGEGVQAQTDVVCINAALAISILNKSSDLVDIFNDCKKTLLAGMALKQFKNLLNG